MSPFLSPFVPSRATTLTRMPYLFLNIVILLAQIISLSLTSSLAAILILQLIFLWMYCNAGAMRFRDMQLKGWHFVGMTLAIILISIVLMIIWGIDCDGPGLRFNLSSTVICVFILSITPGIKELSATH